MEFSDYTFYTFYKYYNSAPLRIGEEMIISALKIVTLLEHARLKQTGQRLTKHDPVLLSFLVQECMHVYTQITKH